MLADIDDSYFDRVFTGKKTSIFVTGSRVEVRFSDIIKGLGVSDIIDTVKV